MQNTTPRSLILISYSAALLLASCGAQSAKTDDFNVAPGPEMLDSTHAKGKPVASTLVFTGQPANATAGNVLVPIITVIVLDDRGNQDRTFNQNITVTLQGGPTNANVLGTTVVAANRGVATFDDLVIDVANANYTLLATSPGLTAATSTTFTITPGPAASLRFAVQPNTTTAGTAMTPAVAVQLQDKYGNATPQPANIALALSTAPTGATLGGTLNAATAANGLATFSNVILQRAGSYTLSASAAGLVGSTSAAFQVIAANPNAALSTLLASGGATPADGVTANILTLSLVDAYGNPVPGDQAVWSVTGSLNTLTPSNLATNANGLTSATLISTQGETKLVTATAGGISETTAVVFYAVPSAANSGFAITPTKPVPADGNSAFTLTVSVRDYANNPMTGESVALTSSDPADSITPNSGVSTGGIFQAKLTSTNPGNKEIQATFGGVLLSQNANFAPPICEDLLFPGQSKQIVGLVPAGPAEADFDGDGILDLATTSLINHTISILTGKGNGKFSVPVTYATDNNPADIATADFNGDGRPDLLVSAANAADVFLNTGNGTFAAKVAYPGLANQGFGVAVADFNADGKPDFVACNRNAIGVYLNAGDGSGTFGAPITSPASQSSPYYLSVADVNGDGHPDVLATGFYDFTLYLNVGDGSNTFTARELYSAAAESGVVTLDVNGDGYLDAVFGFGINLGIMLNDGSGNFAQPSLLQVSTTDAIGTVSAADLNGDGKPDLAVSLYTPYATAGVATLYNQGGGSFSNPVFYPTDNAGVPRQNNIRSSTPHVAVGDLNGDGKPDVAIADSTSTTISVLLNAGDGSGALIAPPLSDTYQVESTTGALASVAADFTGDGNVDVASLGPTSGNLWLFVGNGDGTVTTPYSPFANDKYTSTLVAADFNGDGKLDLVTTSRITHTADVFLNAGNGAFTGPQQFAVGTYPFHFVAGDLNGDGKSDLVVSNGIDNTVSVLLNTGDGSGNFAPQVVYGVGGGPVALADLNGDGKSDIVVAGVNGTQSVLGNGDGTFQNPVGIGAGCTSLTTGDFDGDGNVDIATTQGNISESVWFGNGAGGVSRTASYPGTTVAQASLVAAGDVNGDGKMDLIQGDSGGHSMTVFLNANDGQGTLLTPVKYLSGGYALTTPTLVDMNRDGKLDAVWGAYYGTTIMLQDGCAR